MPLLSPIAAAGDDLRADRNVVRSDRPQLDGAIAEQDAVAGFDVAGEVGVPGGGDLAVADDGPRGDGERRAGVEEALPVFESAKPNLGTLEVEEDGRVASGFGRHGAHGSNAGGVVFMRAMRGVQPKNVHARRENLLEDARRVGGGTEGGNNLRVRHS